MRDCAMGITLGALLLSSPGWAADAAHGKQLFAACIACHSETADAQGPSLKGVAGRKAAALEDFRYSAALMGGAKHNPWRMACFKGFLPARRAQAPAIACFQSDKAEIRPRSRKVVTA